MPADLSDIEARVVGTTIDPRSLLSTDYCNHFNEAIMLMNMLLDMPEMIDEIDNWKFKSYCEHFQESTLAFAPLAIEAYHRAPEHLRLQLEDVADNINATVVGARANLRRAFEDGEIEKFNYMAKTYSRQLQVMVDQIGGVVHGAEASVDQKAIDSLF